MSYDLLNGYAMQSSTRTIVIDVRDPYRIEYIVGISGRDEYKLSTASGIREVITYDQKITIEKAHSGYNRSVNSPILHMMLIDQEAVDRRNKQNLEQTVQQQILQNHIKEKEQELIKYKQKLLLL